MTRESVITVKRTLLATIAAVAAITLASCGGGDPEPEAASSTTETTGPAEPQDVELGDKINITCGEENPCDVDITVSDITVTETCPYRDKNYTFNESTSEEVFVQVTGDINVQQYPGWSTFSLGDSSWSATDSDGYALDIEVASSCSPTEKGRWSEYIEAGAKRRVTQVYKVERVPAQWSLKSSRSSKTWSWPVPQPTSVSEPTTTSRDAS